MSKKQLSYMKFKRFIDISGSLFGLVFLSWLFLLIALILKVLHPDQPIFFKHIRAGYKETHFMMYKFRSMRSDAPTYFERHPEDYQLFVDNDFKFPAGNDPRVTRFGRILRRTSLDELPQLWNVLKGEMSLVGPRPITDPELKFYGDQVPKLLSVRPGMLGLWQALGRSDIAYPERADIDLEYVDNIAFWFDMSIVWKSLKAVFSRKGAF
ncbi:MAG: sugar transferase [Lactobacillaceae bacterium]|jgi:lipopolysaccharide/colanic/teichoic acid biosynthesis glycosyltransferase|nr:sugar transferase [Lactobacillaceae bacterium]